MNDRLLSIEEVAEYCAVKVRTVRTWTQTGRIAYIKLGHYVRIRLSDLERFIAEGRVDPPRRVDEHL